MKDYGKVHDVELKDAELNIVVNTEKLLPDEAEVFGRELLVNEYFVARDSYGELANIYKRTPNQYKPIRLSARKNLLRNISPTKNNYAQMCLVDAMMDEAIDLVIVTGNAGTGKSFMVLATGVHMCKRSMFNSVMYTRELEHAGKDLGFLPGGIDGKTAPFWRSARMTLNKIQRLREEKSMNPAELLVGDIPTSLEEDGKVVFVPLQFLRGADIEKTLMFNDEAQNQDIDTLHMFVTRAGHGSKVVLSGSHKQVDSIRLKRKENGLGAMSNIMRGERNFAHIILEKQERHSLAQQIDERVAKYKAGELREEVQ